VKDNIGQSVMTRVNPKMLEEIAAQAGGKVVVSSDGFPNINALLTQINNLKSTKQVDLEFEVRENRYRIPLAIALICLMILFVADSISVYITNSAVKK
jgi:hypothetical protein